MIETLGNIFFAIVLIVLMAALVFTFFSLFGWAIAITVNTLKEHLKDRKDE